jgi:hypothetical protein
VRGERERKGKEEGKVKRDNNIPSILMSNACSPRVFTSVRIKPNRKSLVITTDLNTAWLAFSPLFLFT